MRVIGTAGHIVHGKSTLVRRLTGIDPDRLKEEKARKLTIDLGFAWFSLDGHDDPIGIVDVPGHRDFIENMLVANSHDTILCFTSAGKVYWLRTFEIPQASRTSRGRPIINILPLAEDERISTILPVKEFVADRFIFMATARGTVKKTSLAAFSRPRSSGLIALDIVEGDRLIGAALTEGQDDVMLVSSAGKAIRFHEGDVREMGRTARGVRGIRLDEKTHVISLIIPHEAGMVLTASEKDLVRRPHQANSRCVVVVVWVSLRCR